MAKTVAKKKVDPKVSIKASGLDVRIGTRFVGSIESNKFLAEGYVQFTPAQLRQIAAAMEAI